MARYFDGTNDYFTLADDAALTLGDDVDDSGPFSFSFWVRFGTMADTDYHDIMSWRTAASRPKAGFFTYGDNHATNAGVIELDFGSADTTISNKFTTAITDSQWHHVAVIFDGTDCTAYLDNVLQFTKNAPTLDTLDIPAACSFGRYYDDSTHWAGDMAEWAKWDVALSTEQIAALADGVRPPEVGTRPAWYMPMLAGLDEEIAGLMVTNNGSTVSEHPPRIVYAGQHN